MALPLLGLLPRLVGGLSGTTCTVGSCFAQLPALCGSSAELAPDHAAALGRLCTPAAGCPTGGSGTCDFPYDYDYDPANTSDAAFQGYFSDVQAATPRGFARALLEASFDSATEQVGSCAAGSFARAEPALQIRAARRFAARAYVLAAETTLDMAGVDGINSLGADQVLALLLNRTVSGARGFCGFCGQWLATLLNDAVLPNGTATPAVTLNLANNYPGYPSSGGLTHVLNTVPTPGPGGELIYATQDAYFSYEFVRCSDRSTPLDLREMLRAIARRNVSEICVPPADDRLYFPRLELAADHAAGNASVVLTRTWGAWAQVADKSSDFGGWVNRTLAMFGCPTEDDGVGNFYYYMLVASWGGKIDPAFVADVRSIVCSEQNPCKKAPQYLPLCTTPAPPPPGQGKCCWDRNIQGCNSSSECDANGEGCVPSGTVTKKYGQVHCDTCEAQHKRYDPSCSCCRPLKTEDSNVSTTSNMHFSWTNLASMRYTFCYNASGLFSEAAVAVLAQQPMMIHGMNALQTQPPTFRQSEAKVLQVARQLLAANPKQQQLYTIQLDFTRTIYASGEWFVDHPECLLRDENNSLVNISMGWEVAKGTPICGTLDNPVCHGYGFQTECGREAWLRYAVQTVQSFGPEPGHGVFIDGFQGCDPLAPGAMTAAHNPCPRLLANASTAQQIAWITGLNETLWELRRRLGKNRTIICNFTGKIYDCNGQQPCFCDAGNEERFYGGSAELAALAANAVSPNPGAIIHVPHINGNAAVFNKSIAGFLAAAGDHTGFGTGFGYPCEEGDWLSPHPELLKPVGVPKGPPHCTGGCSTKPPGHGPWIGGVYTREFASGTKVWYNSSARSQSCVFWGDGSTTPAGDGCDAARAAGYNS